MTTEKSDEKALDMENATDRALAIYKLGQKILECENQAIPASKVVQWGTVREQVSLACRNQIAKNRQKIFYFTQSKI